MLPPVWLAPYSRLALCYYIHRQAVPVSGDECWKILSMGHCLSVFLTIQGQTQTFQEKLFWGYTISIINVHTASQHCPCPGPYSKCSRVTVEVRCSCQELKPCQRETATDEIGEEENYGECSNIKEQLEAIGSLSREENGLWLAISSNL